MVSAVSNLSWSYEEYGIFFHHVLSRSYKGLGLSQHANCPRSLWQALVFLASWYSFAVLAMLLFLSVDVCFSRFGLSVCGVSLPRNRGSISPGCCPPQTCCRIPRNASNR